MKRKRSNGAEEKLWEMREARRGGRASESKQFTSAENRRPRNDESVSLQRRAGVKAARVRPNFFHDAVACLSRGNHPGKDLRRGRWHGAVGPIRRIRPGGPAFLEVAEVRRFTGIANRLWTAVLPADARLAFHAPFQGRRTMEPLAPGVARFAGGTGCRAADGATAAGTACAGLLPVARGLSKMKGKRSQDELGRAGA